MPSTGTKCPGCKPRSRARATESKPSSPTWLTLPEPSDVPLLVSIFALKKGTYRHINFTEFFPHIADPTKYFGCELGAQTQFDFKNERFIVNGSHDAAKLQDMLDGFIRKFVLCENCDNPETDIKVHAKRGILTASCRACGHNYQLDMRHKLATFILRVSLLFLMNSTFRLVLKAEIHQG